MYIMTVVVYEAVKLTVKVNLENYNLVHTPTLFPFPVVSRQAINRLSNNIRIFYNVKIRVKDEF